MLQRISNGFRNPSENQNAENAPKVPDIRLTGEHWGAIIWWAVVIGLLLVMLQALFTNLFVAGAALLFAMACLAGGGLLGFLFGIPRSHQTEPAEPKPDADANTESRENGYRANTNLEQISDWLTKILVGVGLTQLGDIPTKIGEIGTFFGPIISPDPNANVLTAAIFVLFTICGFLFGFLWTRLFLGRQFARADLPRSCASAVVAERTKQEDIDARAMSLVTRYLISKNTDDIDVEELKSSVIKASAPFKVQIFYKAREHRSQSWTRGKDERNIERVVPVFEALIDADKEHRYFKNYAQLGYALKDQPQPDYPRAIENLSAAIRLRDKLEKTGCELFELNRAFCRIMMDENFKQKKPSSEQVKSSIVTDLEAITSKVFELNANEETVKQLEAPTREWMKLNGVKIPALET